MKQQNGIHQDTVNAVKILLTLFTPQQREILEINLNGSKITLAEQFISRWWSYVPVAENPLVFKTTAAKIIETNKNWITFMEKLKTTDIFAKLLDPDNYKERTKKNTSFKMTDKRLIDSEQGTANLVKSLSRTTGGISGVNKGYDYTTAWDKADRERLDKVTLKKEDSSLIKTETGEEDDTRGTDEEETSKSWIEKIERLDKIEPTRLNAQKPITKFSDDYKEPEEKNILLFDASVSQNSNATLGETMASSNTFVDALKRQNYETTREKIVLAQAINNIDNIDFMDIREKIYKKLDILFVHRKKTCL